MLRCSPCVRVIHYHGLLTPIMHETQGNRVRSCNLALTSRHHLRVGSIAGTIRENKTWKDREGQQRWNTNEKFRPNIFAIFVQLSSESSTVWSTCSSEMGELIILPSGKKVGHDWTIDHKLGAGSFGAVYRCSNSKGEIFALKVRHRD